MARPSNNAPKPVGGVVPGSSAHRLMLALRAGPMTSDQVAERFGRYLNDAMRRLDRQGYLGKPAPGKQGERIALTDTGKALVSPGGPLARRTSEIVYCQL